MKVLLFVPERYSLFGSFVKIFESLGADIYPVDYQKTVEKWEQKFNVQVFRLPDKWRSRWEARYMTKINKYYVNRFNEVQPDLVFIYNNEMLLPETLELFKRKSKIAFFLGDHPLYTSLNRYYLSLLYHADAIFSPDTFWVKQLRKMGLKNLYFFCAGIPHDQYFEKQSSLKLQELQSEVLYIGMCYTDNWGYKKARFLNHFTHFDLQIHGNRHWQRWFPFFPELRKRFRLKDRFYSTELMNDLFNATKLIPVDGNPGLINGLHIRTFEALGAGALPVLEWQDDLYEVFPMGSDLPAARSYDEIAEIVRFYLSDEEARKEKVNWMRQKVEQNYSVEKNAALINQALQLKITDNRIPEYQS